MTDLDVNRWELHSSPRAIAPDWASRLRRIPYPVRMFTGLLLGAILFETIHDAGWRRSWLPILVTLALLFAVTVVPKKLNTRIVITPDMVECRDALRRVRRCSRHELVGLVRIPVNLGGWLLTRLLMLDSAGHARLSLQVDAWSDDQLDLIAQKLALPVTNRVERLSPRQVNVQYPGGASLALRFWPFVAVVALIGALLVFGVIVSIVDAL